jgi:hypothetical protein
MARRLAKGGTSLRETARETNTPIETVRRWLKAQHS